GVISLPDPNAFDGRLQLRQRRGAWEDVPYTAAGGRDARGIGLQDMAEAIAAGRPHRASGDLALHVVDVVRSILRSAGEHRSIDVETRVAQPEPLPAAPVR